MARTPSDEIADQIQGELNHIYIAMKILADLEAIDSRGCMPKGIATKFWESNRDRFYRCTRLLYGEEQEQNVEE